MEMTEIARALTTVYHPHPVLPVAGREVKPYLWRDGEPVREILIAQGIDLHQEIVVHLNDRTLTVKEWDTVCPQPGDILAAQAVASGGGDGGSNPVAAVLTIALAIYAPYLAGYMQGAAWGTAATGIGGAALTAGVMVAGSLLINAIVPIAGPKLSDLNGQGDASPTYSLTGGSNRLRPYEPLPVVMGRHRIFPDYGGKPYTEFRGGDDQYLSLILNFGLADMALDEFTIGETPIGSYEDVQFVWSDADGKLPGFPANVDSASGAALTKGEWVTRTTSLDTLALAVDVEGTCYYAGDRGLLSTEVAVDAEYRAVGAAAWLPLATRTVTGYGTHYWSRGWWASDEGSGTYWHQADYGSTQAADHADGADAGIWVPPGQNDWSIATRWRWRPYSEILTAGNGSATKEPAPPQPANYSTAAGAVVGHGAAQKPQRRTFRADVAKGQYEVRVRLASARVVGDGEIPDGDSRGGYQYSFSALRSYQEDTAGYLGQTRLGLVIKASGQLNGTVQQLSATATARCRYWDGSAWAWGATRNPAWWYLHFATGRRNAAGKLLYGCSLADSQIDIDAIKAWAAFCDAEGLTCGLVLDRTQTAADVLNTIARCGLASPSWPTGKLGVVWDGRNQAPVAAFGMSNIIKGSFSVEYQTRDLADEITVSYIDPAQGWSQQQVRVLTPGTTAPARSTTVDLLGCTDAAMAGKFANALAAQQVYRRRTITWEADFEGFVCQRGDVVLLSHDLTQWGYSGRLVAVAGNALTLDRSVPRSGNAEYLMLRRPDGEMLSYVVAAGSGESDTLTLSAAPDLQEGYGPVDHLWFFSPLATPGKKVKIVSVQPIDEYRVRIVATDEDPAYYAAWDGVWLPVASNTLLSSGAPAITGVDFAETLVPVGTGYAVHLAITLTTAGAYHAARAIIRINGAVVQEMTIDGRNATLTVPDSGLVSVTLTPVSAIGHTGQSTTATHMILGTAALTPLPVPGGITLRAQAGAFTLTCDSPDHRAFTGIEIHVSPTPGFAPARGTRAYRAPGAQGSVFTLPDLTPLPVGAPLYVRVAYYSAYLTAAPVYSDELSVTVPASSLTKLLTLSASSQIFKVAGGAASPASITLAAVLIGGLSGTVAWSVAAGTATLAGTGNSRTLTFATLATDTATLTASITDDDGTVYSDSITVAKLSDGASGVTALLTNESHTLAADAAGNVPSYAGAETWMKIFVGAADDTAAWTFAAAASSGVAYTLGAVAGTHYGKVAITALTADTGYVDITASKPGYASITKRFSVAKSKAGAAGDWVSYVFKESASKPATPSGTVPIPSGWLDAPPSSYTYPIWMAKAAVSGSTGQAGAWSAPVQVTGTNGADGPYVVFQYAKNASTSSAPASGWSASPPSLSGGEYMWMRSGTVVPPASSPGSWSTGYRVSGEKGADGIGINGQRGTVNIAYAVGGSSWSDSSANSAISGAGYGSPVNRDVVTLYNNGANYSETRYYNAGSWIALTAYINGNMLVNGTLSASKLSAGTLDAGGIVIDSGKGKVTFGNSNASSYVTMKIETANSSDWGLLITRGALGCTNGYALDASTYGSITMGNSAYCYLHGGMSIAAAGDSGLAAERTTTGFTGKGHSTWGHGLRGRSGSSSSSGIVGCSNGKAFHAELGTAGPFTGSHDVALPANTVIEPGSIVVDKRVLLRRDWSNTFCEVEISCMPHQKGVVGVYTRDLGLLADYTMNLSAHEPAPDDGLGNLVLGPLARRYEAIKYDYDVGEINALGEGQLLVCGEGGDLEPGDLIVTSSLPGIGMRQADDIVRASTVAKCREAVTFSGPGDVRQVACIYLCG